MNFIPNNQSTTKQKSDSKTRNEKSELLVVWVEGKLHLNPLDSQGKPAWDNEAQLYNYRLCKRTKLLRIACSLFNVLEQAFLVTGTVSRFKDLIFIYTIQLMIIKCRRNYFCRFGRKKGVIVPMLFAAVGAAGSVLLTTDDESHKGMRQAQELTR